MTYEMGQWKACCDRCGVAFKSRQLRLEWTGLRVCHGPHTNECWEPRHPQEHLRGVPDRQAPPWTSPRPTEIDVSPGSGNEVSSEDL